MMRLIEERFGAASPAAGPPRFPPCLRSFTKEFPMKRPVWLAPVVVLAAGLCFLSIVRARDDEDEKAKMEAAKKAASDVAKLADAATKPDDLKKEADAVVKKYDELLPIMWQMKPVERGGMQVGKPGTFPNDSIELGLLQLGKKSPSAKVIGDRASDYQRMAEVIRGISSVTPSYAKKFAKSPPDEKVWNGLADDMAKGADDLIAATKGDDAAAFKKAVNNLNHSCNECHTKFRDN